MPAMRLPVIANGPDVAGSEPARLGTRTGGRPGGLLPSPNVTPASIAGGSDEVQRNIIAKHVLKL
jgi:hypothetical protein